MGNKAFHANAALFKSKRMSKNVKLRQNNSVIRPVVAYDCETCVLKEYCEEKLVAFERKMLRKKNGQFKEIDNTRRIRRNYELCHIIGNRNIVKFIIS
jgi:hypothetical protein